MTTDSNDGGTLIERAIGGDQQAFGELYTEHMDAIYRYIFFRVSTREEAEDLTEEVFVKAWEALPSYQPTKHPFTSWLYRIARNLVIDYHRKKRPLSVSLTDLALHSADGAGAEQLLQSQEMNTRLVAAVKQLSDEEQQVVLLRFVEELPHKEVADIIGKSVASSRVIQHHALNKLREILTGQPKHEQ